MENLFSFIFLTFSSFPFIFFKIEKAIQGGAVGGSGGEVTNGAPWHGAPLLVQLVMAHHTHGAPLVVLKKKIKKFFTNGAPWMWCAITSSTNGAPLPRCVISSFKKKL